MLKMQSLSKVYRTEMIETYALRDFNLQESDCIFSMGVLTGGDGGDGGDGGKSKGIAGRWFRGSA